MLDTGQQRIAPSNCFRERVSLERFSDPPFAVIKVDRVVHPPRAVIAPQMMRRIVFVDTQ
ncbi:MAG: hypothetical protein CK530_12380 [Planctomycetaceae bacterium]|nr:MAG: hypothetical protein CK530_12380 [Planctomycetaceae bacterium]